MFAVLSGRSRLRYRNSCPFWLLPSDAEMWRQDLALLSLLPFEHRIVLLLLLSMLLLMLLVADLVEREVSFGRLIRDPVGRELRVIHSDTRHGGSRGWIVLLVWLA